MGKYRFTFTNILFWVGVIASILIFENITFFDKPDINGFMSLGMQDAYFFMLFAIALLSYLALIIYETIFNKVKTNLLVLIPCVFLLGAGITGIILFDGMEFANGAEAIVIDGWQKVKHIMSFILFVFTIYSTIFYFSKNHPSIRRLRYLFAVIILVVYFFIIYSLVTELDKYETIANADIDSTPGNLNIKSLFLNPNMFAVFILMGICACIGLNYFKKNAFSFISIVGFTIIQVFVCSLTCILITLTMILIYFIFEIILSFKKNKNRPIPYIVLFIMLAGYTSVIILFCLAQSFDVPKISGFCRFLYREISQSNYSSFSNRIELWNNALYASNQNIFTLLFGYGFRNSEYIVGGLMNTPDHRISCHNGYLQLLLNFGVVGLACFALFIGVYIYCLIRLLRRHMRFTLCFSVIGLAYFALGATESFIPFAPSAQGILIGALFFLPVVNKYTHLRHQEVGNSALEDHSTPVLLEPHLMARLVSRTLLSFMGLAATFLFLEEFRNDTHIFYAIINSLVVLGILFLSYPYLCALWCKTKSLYKFIFHNFLFVVLLAATAGGYAYLVFTQGINVPQNMLWIAPIAFVLLICIELIIYTVLFKGSFSLYANTFVAFKTSLGSLIFLGLYFVAVNLVKDYLILSPITYICLGVEALLVFYIFSFVTPFKDLFDIVSYSDEFDANLMKIDVTRDRLEELYEI